MQNNWIKVTDRLPEDTKPILIFEEVSLNISIGYYKKDSFYNQFHVKRSVKFWQNLPSPPEQEETK